jgi:hypothetical protein
MYEIGKQYDIDNSFKKKARLHQSKYRTEILQVDYDEYGNRLTETDAKSGLNFYNGFDIFNAVKKRYPKYSKGLYADMLRSEHIPFNIFIPLKTDTELARYIFSSFLPVEIVEIIAVKIEYAPSPAKEYLNDRTAFDTFIEYKNNRNEHGIIGIEVKYTEQEYKLQPGSKEEKDIQNKNSIYYQLIKNIGLYKSESIMELPKDRYRQVWRNQLLGESMIVKKDLKYSEFTSIILYPAGNNHFTEVANEYKEFLSSTSNDRFFAITFESFFKLIEKNINSEELRDWVSYLKVRYLFE